MKKQLMTQVTNSIFEVMETMFYLALEESPGSDPDNPPGGPDRFKTASISFSGEFTGTVFISIPNGLLITMTEDFLGQDIETLTAEHVDGTLKEALNMIAGSALTKMDNTTYMGLGIPRIVPSASPGDVDESVVLTAGEDILIARVKLG